jgi:hypothetical protein
VLGPKYYSYTEFLALGCRDSEPQIDRRRWVLDRRLISNSAVQNIVNGRLTLVLGTGHLADAQRGDDLLGANLHAIVHVCILVVPGRPRP